LHALASTMQSTSLRVGLKNKGFKTEKLAPKARPSRRKGVRVARARAAPPRCAHALAPAPPPTPPLARAQILNKRVKVVREIISEVAGLAPYEKRVLDVIKTGGANAEKRSYKLAKQRLGTHKRALRKREQLKQLYAKQRAMK